MTCRLLVKKIYLKNCLFFMIGYVKARLGKGLRGLFFIQNVSEDHVYVSFDWL
jgi:hypothetical protein